MAVDFKYKLNPSPKKYPCPACGKKTFTFYVDNHGMTPGEHFGRCDREQSCGYHLKPSEEKVIVEPRQFEIKSPSLLPLTEMTPTFTNVDQSNLHQFLSERIGADHTKKLFEKYMVGADQTLPSTIHWSVFWQIDIEMKIRGAKLIRYKPNGRRDHSQQATWYHSIHKDRIPEYNLVQCFFGEHLLKINPISKVAVVESEKTAMIASHFMTQYTWIACGGKHGLSPSKVQTIKNRSVTLFPDLGAYNDWKLKASEYGFTVSRILEDIATPEQKEQGLDLADFLLPDEN